MSLVLKGVFSFRGMCPRHKQYNPIKSGQGAIKGGCPKCNALYKVWSSWIIFMKDRNYADDLLA